MKCKHVICLQVEDGTRLNYYEYLLLLHVQKRLVKRMLHLLWLFFFTIQCLLHSRYNINNFAFLEVRLENN